LAFDAMNSNTFQDNPTTTGNGAITYKFGSLCNTDPGVRKLALEHNRHVIDLGVKLGSTAITVWLADGINHPGQANFRTQFERVQEGLSEIHDALPDGWLMFTEHKPYEPALYSSVNNDWGTSLLLAQGAGPNARCLVDLGHHLPNTNIEQVVSRLAMVGRLGGFHFNDSKYGDDDLTVGSIKPFQLFLIVNELLDAGDGRMPRLAYMIDESHNLKDPIEDLIQATDAIQHTLALALCINRDDLADAQAGDDPARAAEILHRAFRTDVRPFVAEARRRNHAALAPLDAYRASGYRAEKTAERGTNVISTGL
jgi:L-rhamnose isomerase/sugar isomerase